MTLTFLHMRPPLLWLTADANTLCPVSWSICRPVCAHRALLSTQRHPVKYAWYPTLVSLSKGAVVPHFFFSWSYTALHPAPSDIGLRDYRTNINTHDENLKGECHCWQVPVSPLWFHCRVFPLHQNRCQTASPLRNGVWVDLLITSHWEGAM